MKNSILVAVIAAATMLTACGSKKDSPADAPKATQLSEKTQENLQDGVWLSSCENTQGGAPAFIRGSEKVRLNFGPNNTILVTEIVYSTEDCVGASKSSDVGTLVFDGTQMGTAVTLAVYNSTELRPNSSEREFIKADLVGTYNVSFKGDNIMVLKSKSDINMRLNGTYTHISDKWEAVHSH